MCLSLRININDIVRFLASLRGRVTSGWGSTSSSTGSTSCTSCVSSITSRSTTCVGVRCLSHFHELLLQVLGHFLQHLGIRLCLSHCIPQGRQLGVDGCLQVCRHLVAEFLHLLLGLVDQGLGVVLGLYGVLPLGIRLGVGLSILHHAVHVILVERGRASDRHSLFLARAAVLGRDVKDAVGINVEGHLNLRDTSRSRRHAIEAEGAQDLVVLGKLPLTLQDHNLHRRLRVHGCGKDLCLLGWDCGVA
mmetsp:Transcript_67073/g.146268  ORF Transcript_67073/g.146268 Transcript_67073/m.146268 type:complete len:248 (-) Transcript_67073:1597-2340(-)